MERIDSSTWRTDNGDEVRARGLRLTVEFGERTKAEVLRAKDEVMHAVEAVEAENAKLRDLIYDIIVDEERGHNDDGTFREHVIRAHEYGIAQDVEVGE